MSGNKRARELARAKYERQQQRRQASAARRRLINRIVGTLVVVVLVAGGLVWAFASGTGGGSSADPTASPTASPTSSPEPTPEPSPTGSGDGCRPPAELRTTDLSWPSAPADTLAPGTDYSISFRSNCGDIVITADAATVAKAPQTVNSMVFLAGKSYFDKTGCHRLTTSGIFVLQCGDPTGTGTGGPGYSVPDENLPPDSPDNYPAGTVAMANAGPGTAGSQFFIVYEDTTLPPNYTIWGTVTKGLDVVRRIAAQGVSTGESDGPPAQPVTFTRATVTQKPA